jgi:replication factor C subunit 3/5
MDKLWCDKYRPKSLGTMDYHTKLNSQLKKLAFADDLPHLLIYGPNGAGKKTRIMAFLADLYGPGVYKVKLDNWEFKVSPTSSTKVEIAVISSNYHIDITPSDVDNYDRVVLQKLIKEVASVKQIDPKAQKTFKVVIINECDRLSKDAQAALRRTMEKYVAYCRLILCCENLGRVIQPLRSRCLLMRVPAPDNFDIANILLKIARKENTVLSEILATRIAEGSERNLRKALLQFQTLRMQKYPFNDSVVLHIPEWKQAIRVIADDIAAEQSPKQIRTIRDKVYDLLINCIPGDVIIKTIIQELNKKVDKSMRFELIHWAAHHERRLQLGSKAVFHIEAFIARVMVVYKRYTMH